MLIFKYDFLMDNTRKSPPIPTEIEVVKVVKVIEGEASPEPSGSQGVKRRRVEAHPDQGRCDCLIWIYLSDIDML